MKKTSLILFIFIAILLQSCEHCMECKYEYNGVTYRSGETCGSKQDIQDIKDSWMLYDDFIDGDIEIICDEWTQSRL